MSNSLRALTSRCLLLLTMLALASACDCGGPGPKGDGGADDGSADDGSVDGSPEGGPDVPTVNVCGDGVVLAPEACDDGNVEPGDGCDAFCQLEEGFHCPTPNAPCEATRCGDGVAQGLEQCDDWIEDDGEEDVPFDGCYQCKWEPRCSGGICESNCGDGVIFGEGEECDDGNRRGGDGCSADCKLEPGFDCVEEAEPLPDTLELPVIYRDFFRATVPNAPDYAHEDFHNPGFNYICFGLVHDELDGDGRPRLVDDYTRACAGGSYNESTPENQTTFSYWYRDDNEFSKRTPVETLSLASIAEGSYQFSSTSFFPLDGKGWQAPGESPAEPSANDGSGTPHNFGFTSETHYWFEYKGDEVLEFFGDDDVWVFIDQKLCLDIGGIHSQMNGVINFSNPNAEPNATNRALVAGCKQHLEERVAALPPNTKPIFEIAIFQAERNPTGSNYRLSLAGFVKQRTVCTTVCGDGIRTGAEQCDDGENNGTPSSYCAEDCTVTLSGPG